MLCYVVYKTRKPTLQEVGQGLGPEDDGAFGLVVGDGELLHPQLLRNFGLRAVVDQRTAEKLHANTDGGSRIYANPLQNIQIKALNGIIHQETGLEMFQGYCTPRR